MICTNTTNYLISLILHYDYMIRLTPMMSTETGNLRFESLFKKAFICINLLIATIIATKNLAVLRFQSHWQ